MTLVLKEEVFLANKRKKITIYKHSLAKFRGCWYVGCTVDHAVGDADRQIVKKAVELSETTDTILVSEDTDLLFFFYTMLVRTQGTYFFALSQSRIQRGEAKFGIYSCVSKLLGQIVWKHIIHSCNLRTWQRIKSLWSRLRALIECIHTQRTIQKASNNFFKWVTIKRTIVAAGERALAILYNGKDDDRDQMRYSMFCEKLVSSKTQVKPQVLLPPHCGCFVK